MVPYSPVRALRLALLAAIGVQALACDSSVSTGGAGAGNNSGGHHDNTGGSGAGVSTGGGGGVGGAGGAGGAGGSGAAGGGGSGGTGGSIHLGCANPTPIPLPDGQVSGMVRCADGSIDRVGPATCTLPTNGVACDPSIANGSCATDVDCTNGPHGRCLADSDEDGNAYCGCQYACESDADCSASQACLCAGAFFQDPYPEPYTSKCVPAPCQAAADCGSNECGLAAGEDGCGRNFRLACRKGADACRNDAQCDPTCTPQQLCSTCGSDGDKFACSDPFSCQEGRAVLVDGMVHCAPLEARADWMAPGSDARTEPIERELAAALARHWEKTATAEHASIASFARFSIQLLAVGAPPEFLLETQLAAAEEVEHARMAFALASRYGGGPVGPGSLDVSGLSLGTDRWSLIRDLIEEACVNEVLNVAESGVIAAVATDPDVRAFHQRVAEDETRHAALAWRVLRWALERATAEERAAAKALLTRTIARALDVEPRPHVDPARGLLSRAEASGIRRQTLRDVIGPCKDALFGANEPAAAVVVS